MSIWIVSSELRNKTNDLSRFAMSNKKSLLILGFGGHARSVADIALACGYEKLLFVDDNAQDGESLLGFPVIKTAKGLAPEEWQGFAASGDNDRRRQQCDVIVQLGLDLATLVSPTATLGVGSQIGPGCLVAHHAHLGPMARVGKGCILNTGAIVEHECVVGDYSHVSIQAAIAGRSVLGAYSMLGANACIIDGVRVSDWVTIGAGALVHRHIDEPGVYVGVPAKRLPDRTSEAG